ncbi:TonB-dependent receptor [Sphingobium nicotianae]|uniref:TonB-dependent receptor n=1 Tax=Sphingobium nicotianae TaxID=2782607 RepID=A0A9X1DEV6_9SPHN|nr:TonB-dependent receptor [Sphingobium nicotianae]MBT2188253.1 TonB-dependent receptor [Sphingobium nicotianae]
MAQDQKAADAESASTNGGIEDIVVTARYVSENIQDTPIAITAQTSTQLEAANVTNIGTLGAVVPNLLTMPGDAQSAGTPVIGMRGVLQGLTSSLAVPPAVAIYTDDIYHGTAAGSELDFTDIDHVEVNRGPQSTLSGNASIAGSIKLYTKDPRGDGTGYISLGGGSRKHMEAAGAIDLGITDTLAIRASGHFDRQQGFGNRLDFSCMMDKLGTPALKGRIPYFQPDSANRGCVIGHLGGGTTAVGQVKLLWKPTSDISLLVTARHREEDLEETPEVSLLYRTACFDTPGCGASAGAQAYHRATFKTFGVVIGPQFVTPQRSGGIYDTYATNCRPTLDKSGGGFPTPYADGFCYDQGKTAHHTLLSGKLNAQFSENLAMTAIVGYTDYANEFTAHGDQSPLAPVISHFHNLDDQWTGELRFNGKLFDKLEWVAGGFIMRLNGQQNNMISFSNIYQLSKVKGKNESQSAFFHLDYNLSDRWRVSGGARYSDTKIAITIDNPQAVSVLAPISSAQTRIDWLISTDFKITDDILAYASASSGSRPPGLTTIVTTPRQLSPTSDEDLISYELGLKADLLDRRLRTNLTAFYMDYRKLSTGVRGIECRNQPGPVATWFNVDQTDPASITTCAQFPGAPDPIAYVINIGKPAKVKGFEWDITAIPTDGLRIDWAGGYNKFTSGVTTANAPGYLAPGNHRQPEWNMHANISYDIETGFGTFTPRLDWNWQSQQDYDPTPQTGLPDPAYVIAPYSIFNGQIAYKAPGGDWSAVLQVTNLADKWYHYQVLIGTINGYTRVAPPREFKLTVRHEF